MRGPNRGKRLYRCDECKAASYFTRNEENRAGRLRCPGCGSARLEVSALGASAMAESRNAQLSMIDSRRRASGG